MFNRKRLDRERLEVYLVHLLLAYRTLTLMCGMILLVFSAAILAQSLLLGSLMLTAAALLLGLGLSYRAVVLTARLGAWAVVLLKKNDETSLNGR